MPTIKLFKRKKKINTLVKYYLLHQNVLSH